jgi:histidinol-phosphate/aromatic aminotransferase/cobyric acid decarboxylase-like protein
VKPAFELAKENFRNLKPCVHGADIFEAADKTGFRCEDILDFSSSVNPLGASEMALEAAIQIPVALLCGKPLQVTMVT